MSDTNKIDQNENSKDNIIFDEINNNIDIKIKKNKTIKYKYSKEYKEIFEEFKKIDNDDFRINNVSIMLSYPGIINKIIMKEFIIKQTKGQMKGIFKDLYIAHELNEKEKYNSTHILIYFNKKYECKNKKNFEFDGIIPRIIKIDSKNRDQWDISLEFLTNNDNQIKNETQNKLSLTENIMNCSTELEACKKFVVKPSDVHGVSAIFKMKNEKTNIETTITDLYLWQTKIKEIVHTTSDGRTVYWLYDKVGGSGKTEFIKWFMKNFPEKSRFTKHLNCRDLSTTVQGWVEDEKFDGDTIFVDLVRSLEDKKIYEGLEMLLDSMLTSQKYKGKSVLWKKCHIVVCSNFLPKVKCLSLDRWNIMEINKNKDDDYDLSKLNTYDVLKTENEEEDEELEAQKLIDEHKEKLRIRERNERIKAKAKIEIDKLDEEFKSKYEKEKEKPKTNKLIEKNEKLPTVNDVIIIPKKVKEEVKNDLSDIESVSSTKSKKKRSKIKYVSDDETDSLSD
jgi:hypothetical protein